MKKSHAVYPGGPPCQPNCPGEHSMYHDGYADGYENAESAAAADVRPESVLSNLRSHAFPTCLICGSYVDDPEAIEYCEGPTERERRNHDVAVVNATNRNAVIP